MKKLFFIISANILILASTYAQPINGTYAIQNTITGKNLRPYDAGSQNGNRIVLYDHALYITASSAQTNTGIILQEKQSNALQMWLLVLQNPDM